MVELSKKIVMEKNKLMLKSLLQVLMTLDITVIPLRLLQEVMMKDLLVGERRALKMKEKVRKVKELLQEVILVGVLVKA